MGIKGLMPFIKPYLRKGEAKEFTGEKVAVDVYCFLHKATYGCAFELCQGIPTTKYVNYCLRRFDMLKHFGVEPIAVFDGGQLPMKLRENTERREQREAYLQKGRELLAAGNRQAAEDCFRQAAHVTPEMAHELMKELRKRGIPFVVAPYEADAQIAWMTDHGIVSGVITEDSDLAALGCPKILFKMDEYGNGEMFDAATMYAGPMTERAPRFTSWSKTKFLLMCILAGCDYLPSLHGMGMATAFKLLSKVSGDDMAQVWLAIARSKPFKLTSEYMEAFNRAAMTFQHQTIWDMDEKVMKPRTPLPTLTYQPLEIGPVLRSVMTCQGSRFAEAARPHTLLGESVRGAAAPDEPVAPAPTGFGFLGPVLEGDLARRVCTGLVDPFTHEPFAAAPAKPKTPRRVVPQGGAAALREKHNALNATRWVQRPESRPGRRALSAFSASQLPVARNITPVATQTTLMRASVEEGSELLELYSGMGENGQERVTRSRFFVQPEPKRPRPELRAVPPRSWSIAPPAMAIDLDGFRCHPLSPEHLLTPPAAEPSRGTLATFLHVTSPPQRTSTDASAQRHAFYADGAEPPPIFAPRPLVPLVEEEEEEPVPAPMRTRRLGLPRGGRPD